LQGKDYQNRPGLPQNKLESLAAMFERALALDPALPLRTRPFQ